ncbi:MAG: sarcosine oxidase subunit gamma [Paracoccaceae bacterium]
MHDLVAITALGGTDPQVDSVGTVTCSEVPGVALASVAVRLGKEQEATAALAELTGAPAPGVGRFESKQIASIWIGPDQWLVEAPFETHENLADQAKAATGNAASVSEQTDAWARFDLIGSGVLAVLELLCPLDTRRMVEGDVARTSIHHLGCFILCRASEQFSVYGPRSSAGSLHHAIVTAMKSAL